MFDKDELLRQARAIKAESESIVKRTEESHQSFLRNLPGGLHGRVTNSRSEAEQCLCHADKNVRIAALESLQDVWQAKDMRFQAACKRMIVDDCDEEVKAVAINCLAKCHEGTNEESVAKWLAGFVKNDSLSTTMRTAAYFGLLVLAGDFQRHPELILDFAFPDNVDWSFVDRLC